MSMYSRTSKTMDITILR